MIKNAQQQISKPTGREGPPLENIKIKKEKKWFTKCCKTTSAGLVSMAIYVILYYIITVCDFSTLTSFKEFDLTYCLSHLSSLLYLAINI